MVKLKQNKQKIGTGLVACSYLILAKYRLNFFINNTQTTPKTKILSKIKTRKPLILKDLRAIFIGAANGTWTRTSKTHAPQTCLSAYSSTAAIDFNIIALKFIIVNSFFVFLLGFTVCSLLINYCTKLFPVLSLLLLKDQN